jgi:hypothetical protein
VPQYTLPDTVHGGSVTVQGSNLADAQHNAATQTGASDSQQQGGGTFGSNTNSSDPALNGGGGGGGGGGSSAPSASAATLGNIANQMQQALASGNKAAFDEAVREYNTTFGLDQQKYQASVDQYNQSLAVTAAGLTGTYNGQQTQAAQQQAFNQQQATQTQALASQKQQQDTANQYLTLLASLKGPQNSFAYAQTLAGTPRGMTDIVNAAAGRYLLGSPASGANPAAPANLNNLMVDVNSATGGASSGSMAQQQQPGLSVGTNLNGVLPVSASALTPAVPQVDPAAAWAGASPSSQATYLQYAQGNTTLAQQRYAADVAKAQAQAVAAAVPAYTPAQPAMTSPPGAFTAASSPGAFNASAIPDVSGLPAANQINAGNFNQMDPTQQALLWAAYQYGGGPGGGAMDPLDAQAAYKKSLPGQGVTGGAIAM